MFNCKCVNYGQIDPKKIEALRKVRAKQMCNWKELSLFRDHEIKEQPRVGHQSTSKPMFPPIYHCAISCQEDHRGSWESKQSAKYQTNKNDSVVNHGKDKGIHSLPPL